MVDNGDATIIETLEKEVDELLNNTEAAERELIRGALKVMRLYLPYFRESHNDHRRTMLMWSTYKWLAGAMAAVAMLFLTFLWGVLTHEITIIYPGG